MLVASVELRDFRTYIRAHAELGERLTVVHGPNGVGKTNLLEALYFGCTGRSMRTNNEREVIHFDSKVARVVVHTRDVGQAHELSVGYGLLDDSRPTKRMMLDGSPVERLTDTDSRPLLSVFFPDRMELIKGSPSLRRAHLNQLVDTLWPARRAVRQRYSHALLQRNALLASIRAGRSSPSALPSWDRELAHHAVQVVHHRREAIELLEEPFCSRTSDLGLNGTGSIKYAPKSRAEDPEQFLTELSDHLSRDLNRGFSTYGPHRDDLVFSANARDLRSYGSQGEQRLTLLALLLAERDVLQEVCGSTPLMLLDDVMSELDRSRRELLIDALSNDGQSIITTTDPDHVPTRDPDSVRYLAVTAGAISESDYEYRSGVLT